MCLLEVLRSFTVIFNHRLFLCASKFYAYWLRAFYHIHYLAWAQFLWDFPFVTQAGFIWVISLYTWQSPFLGVYEVKKSQKKSPNLNFSLFFVQIYWQTVLKITQSQYAVYRFEGPRAYRCLPLYKWNSELLELVILCDLMTS